MSNQRLAQTYELDAAALGLSRSAIAVLRWLAWRENKDDGRCNPSHPDIASGTGYATTAVKDALKQLRERGLVSWKGRARPDKRGRTSNFYTLHLRPGNDFRSSDLKPGSDVRSNDLRPGNDFRSGPNDDSRRQVTHDLKPGNDYEPKRENLKELASEPADEDLQVGQLFDFWQESTERPDTVLTPKRRQAFERAITFPTCTVAKLCEAMGQWQSHPYLSGARDGTVRNEPGSILHDLDIVEELIGLTQKPSSDDDWCFSFD